MIRKLYQYSLLIFALTSCTVTTVTDDNITPGTPATNTSGIRDQVAQGKATSTDPFVLKTALYRSEKLFGKDGYRISFFDKATDCQAVIAPISFFLTKLEPGTFKGEGPYFYYYKDANNFGTTSYFGCDVVITKVTPTTVEGKIKGGEIKENQYIEGNFTATLCK